MSHHEPSRFRETLEVLSPGPFRRYIIGEAVSMTGTWMQVMAQAWVMTTLTNKALMLGMVNFASGIPMLALTMTGGAFADRYDKRGILLLAQVAQIILALIVGFLVFTGAIQIWHVLAVAVLLGVTTSFEMPAASALVPELVGRERLASAIAVDRSVFHATRLIGPAAAGYTIGAWGVSTAFFVNALSFTALFAALLSLPKRAPATAGEEAERRSGIAEGFRYVRGDRPTFALIILMALTTVFVFPAMMVIMPLYVKNVLGFGAERMGIMMAFSGAGPLIGSIGLLAIAREKRALSITLGLAGAAVGVLGLAIAQSFAAAAASVVLLGVSVSTQIGLANTIIQERAPAALRGRVSAIAGLSFFGLMPIAGLLVTGLADAIGIRSALGVAAAAYAIGGSVTLLRVKLHALTAGTSPVTPEVAPAPAASSAAANTPVAME